jgi:hypothetical protein
MAGGLIVRIIRIALCVAETSGNLRSVSKALSRFRHMQCVLLTASIPNPTAYLGEQQDALIRTISIHLQSRGRNALQACEKKGLHERPMSNVDREFTGRPEGNSLYFNR